MPKITWSTAPSTSHFVSSAGVFSAIRKKLRPKFSDVYRNVLASNARGREKLLAMMKDIKGTSADKPFVESIVDADLVERFGGELERNKDTEAKSKKHEDAIDFQMGEQMDGAANELRGAVVRKEGQPKANKPDAILMLDPGWKISDARFLDLVDWATKNQGPLAESVNRKLKTNSTSKGRVATFVVDYVAAIVTAHAKHAQAV